MGRETDPLMAEINDWLRTNPWIVVVALAMEIPEGDCATVRTYLTEVLVEAWTHGGAFTRNKAIPPGPRYRHPFNEVGWRHLVHEAVDPLVPNMIEGEEERFQYRNALIIAAIRHLGKGE